MVGLHTLGEVAKHIDVMKRWQPRAVLLIDPEPGDAKRVRDVCPGAFLIGRVFRPDGEVAGRIQQNPEAAGQWAADVVVPVAASNREMDVWQVVNEVEQTDSAAIQRLARFSIANVDALRAIGLRAAIGAFSVGQPHTPYWPLFYEAMRHARRHNGVLLLHAYGAPRIFDSDPNWYLHRYERSVIPTLPADLRDMPYVYGEYGCDMGVVTMGDRRGWKTGYGGDAAAYASDLRKAAEVLADTPGCRGACVFALGKVNDDWVDFNIEGSAAEALAAVNWPRNTGLPYPSPVTPPKVEGPVIRVLMPGGTVQTMPVEEYLRGVVPSEMPATWMPHALMAQAVAARTYARYNVQHPKHHFEGADVCVTEHCQVYNPAKIANSTDQAIQATAGVVLWHDRKPINAVYSARCGGKTASGKERWNVEVDYWTSVWCPCSPDGQPRHGHGVGLCQHGAQRLAQQGHSYEVIAWHYYHGVGIGKEAEMSVTRLISMLRAEFGDKFHDVRSQMTVSTSQKFSYADSRKMKYIVLHHATGNRDMTAKAISDFHVNTRGWAGVGYHTIGRLGELFLVGDPDTARAHVAGRNHEALGHCITGDYTSRDAAPEDVDVFRRLVKVYDAYYGHEKELAGHRELLAPGHTTCPARLLSILPSIRAQVIPTPTTPTAPVEPVPEPVAAVHSVGIAEPEVTWGESYWMLERAEVIADGRNTVTIESPPDHSVSVTRLDTGETVTFPLATTKVLTLGGPRIIGITPGKSTAVSVARTGASLRLWFRPAQKVRAA